MLRHYLTAALAKFARSPFTTAANVLTLALGLTCFIAAYGIASYWGMSDRHFAAADRTYVLTQHSNFPRFGLNTGAHVRSAPPAGFHLAGDVPELDAVARFNDADVDVTLASGSTSALMQGAFVDPAFLDIFDFDFIAGDPRSALQSQDGLILTRSAAQRLFGDAPALGQSVNMYRQTRDMETGNARIVTGVIDDIPEPTHLGAGPDAEARFDYLRAWPADDNGARSSWISHRVITYMVLPEDGSFTVDALRARLARLPERITSPQLIEHADIAFGAIPLSAVRARQLEVAVFANQAGRFSVTAVLLGLSALVLAAACFNCSNLLTAQAIGRTREFGIRKALGADRARMALQSWLEAGIVTVVAFAIAVGAIALSAPVFRQQAGIDLAQALTGGWRPVAVAAGLCVATTAASAAYPILVATGVRPAQAIGARGAPHSARGVLMTLVGVQFAAASVLLIGVIVLNAQNTLLRRAAVASSVDPVLVLNTQGRSGVDIDMLAQRLEPFPQIRGVSEMDQLPWSSQMDDPVPYVGAEAPDASERIAARIDVGFGFFDVFGLEPLAGRVFDQGRDAGAPENRIVVDRAFAEQLGFASPEAAVGQLIRYGPTLAAFGGPENPPLIEIIGVVEARPMYFNGMGTQGGVYRLRPGLRNNFPIVRIAADDVGAGVAAVEGAWAELSPQTPPNIRFADALFEDNYRAFGRISLIFTALSTAAIVISAMGLFATASHVTQSRVHEVGVRKIIGARALSIAALFVRQFSAPIVIANLLAWPVAYLGAQAYLSAFALRIELGPEHFLASLAITLGAAWLVVCWQTCRAASVRPAEVLRQA